MNTGFLIAVAVFGLATAAALLWPLFRTPASRRSRWGEEREIYRDQLAQLAADRESGLIPAEDADAAEAEISRALIAAQRREETAETSETSLAAPLLVAACVAVLVGAGGLYATLGAPEARDLPLAARDVAATPGAPSILSEHEGAQMGDAMAALATRLAEDPDDAEGWRLLARSYAAVGADARAVEAYEKLLSLLPDDVETTGDLAESRVYAEGGLVTAEAASGFAAVLETAPSDPRARYYIALKEAQAGESEEAVRQWAEILREAAPDAPYLDAIWQIVDATIRDAGLDAAALDLPERSAPALAALPPGPTAEDVAAAAEMSDSDQMDMIRSMVARLEERLIEEPGDIDGWLRLARSRAVLGEPDQAAAALRAALTVNPGEPRLAAALQQLNGGE